MLKWLTSAASGFLGNWQAYLAAFGIGLVLASLGTWRVMSWREQAHQTQAVIQTVKLIEHQAQISNAVSIKFEGIKANDQADTRKRIDTIPEHITPISDATCPVPIGFVRVFNDAAHGPVPDTASGSDDTASGVALSDVAKATVENFGAYDQVAHQLTALQDWIREQMKANP